MNTFNMAASEARSERSERRAAGRTGSAANRLRLFLAAPIVAFGVGCATPPPPPPPPKPVAQVEKPVEPKKTDFVGEGNQQFLTGALQPALKSYEAALQAKPDDEAALYNKAVVLHRLGQREAAIKAYEAVLAKNPEHGDAILNLGSVLRDDGKVDEAIRVYEKRLEKEPYDSRVLNNLVVLYRSKKQYPKAITAVRKLLMRDQKNVDAYKNLALVYYDQEKYKLAQTILANALKMSKAAKVEDPDIHVDMGMTHIALGDPGLAMASFKEAVRIDAKNVVANYNIGSLALEHRDYALADKAFTVVQSARPDDFEVVRSLGYAYQGEQKHAEAAAQLEKAFGMKSDKEIANQLVNVYTSLNDAEKAKSWFDKLLELEGKKCGEKDLDGLCGRYKGVLLMIQMKNQPAPKEEEKKPKSTGVEIFKEGPAPGDEGAGAPPAEGGEGAGAAGGAAPDAAATKTATTAGAK